MTGLIVLSKRELKKWFGRRPVLVMSLITPLIWIALFGKSFNLNALVSISAQSIIPPQLQGFIDPKVIEGIMKQAMENQLKAIFGTTDYFTFFASGMLVAFSIFQGAFGGVGVVFDKRLGYMRRILVTPIRRSYIYIAKLIGTLTRISILSLILLAASIPLGFKFKPELSIIDLTVPWIAIMLLSITILSIYMLMAFYTDNQEVLFAASNLINLPLMFASNAIFPLKQMPDWLQVIAKYNPVTHAAYIVRYHLIGTSIPNYWESMAYLVVSAVVLLSVSIYYSVKKMEKGI
jgi:ABC-2 type transport system permease protein